MATVIQFPSREPAPTLLRSALEWLQPGADRSAIVARLCETSPLNLAETEAVIRRTALGIQSLAIAMGRPI